MQVSLEWLRDHVDVPALDELVPKLEAAGIEVEAVDDPAARVRGVVIGKVIECAAHPEADRLISCKVTDGRETFAVICGAANVAAGQVVAFARVGAKLGGFEIGRRKIRGIESAGMLCSRDELGLTGGQKSDGIWVLPDDATLGADLFSAFDIAPVLTLGITPNRPDLLSHYGVAREVAAATGQRLKGHSWRVSEMGPEVTTLARVLVEDPRGCDRYVARIIQGVTIGPSPRWLRERLERVGQRSINNVVDATNYVLFDLGQPTHAFDLGRLALDMTPPVPTLHVRRARPGEKLRTLDNVDVERELDPEDLVIADAEQVLALAGVMGGATSEVAGSTTAILLESAHFDPVSVRRTARRHGMHTEASHRFERGADPQMALRAADRCAQLFAELGGGCVAKGTIDVAAKAPPPPEVALRLEQIPRLLGIDVPAERVVELLDPLEIRCSRRNQSALHFTVPSFRADLTREIDLIEEVARRHGYETIPETLPGIAGEFHHVPSPRAAADVAREGLICAGCSEIVTFGFGSPASFAPFTAAEGEPLCLRNPLGEELSAMRTTLLPGLFAVAGRNQRHGQVDLRLFEIGRTFHPQPADPNDADRERGLPREELRVGVIACGGRHGGRWYQGAESLDFSDIAGMVETLIERFDPEGPLHLRAAALPELSPHAGAEVWVGGRRAGVVGQLHPQRASDLAGVDGGNVYIAELSLDVLGSLPRRQVRHRPLPKYPGTRRDVAVVVDRTVSAETLRAFLVDHAGGALGAETVESVRLFDVYTGKPIPKDRVSLAFAIEYRSVERTLTDTEVGAAFEAVLEKLQTEYGLEIR